MNKCRRLLSIHLIWPLLVPTTASALVVEVQGTRLESQLPGSSCVEIAGNYPGVTIEPSESGKIPRICYNSRKVNSITILDSLFVGAKPLNKDVVVKFEHGFPTGINGKIMARAKLQGFFSTHNGLGVPTGDKVSLSAFFSQTKRVDTIGDPLDLTVGDEMDSALFDYSAKEQYLASGPRTLRGIMKLQFTSLGDRLTLTDKSSISVDTGSTMADKLDTMGQQPEEILEEETEQTTAPAAPAAPKPKPPANLPMPFPPPSGNQDIPSPLP